MIDIFDDIYYHLFEGIRNKSENENNLNSANKRQTPENSVDSQNKTKRGTTVNPLFSTESIVTPTMSDSSETVRSVSEEDVGSRPKGSPTSSQVLAYSPQSTDNRKTKPESTSLVDNTDTQNNQNNS